jgi:hypothetical protein
VVPADGEPWERVIDLRVEEGDDSLERLRELLDRAEGYRRWNRATDGRVEIARAAVPRAALLGSWTCPTVSTSPTTPRPTS